MVPTYWQHCSDRRPRSQCVWRCERTDAAKYDACMELPCCLAAEVRLQPRLHYNVMVAQADCSGRSHPKLCSVHEIDYKKTASLAGTASSGCIMYIRSNPLLH